MAFNIKRLICRRLGGSSNVVSLVLLTIVLFLLIKTYYPTDYNTDLIDNESSRRTINNVEENKKHGSSVDSGNIGNNKNSTSKNQIIKPDETKSVQTATTRASTIKQTRKPLVTIDPECKIDDKCSTTTVPFKLISGEGMDKYPIVCFNGQLIIGKRLQGNKIGRGINVAAINYETLEVKAIHNFDTFVEDAHFHRFIKTDTVDGDLILIVSYDEMANGLRDPTKKFMEFYGSEQFKKIKYRDSYVMIGQRGISLGQAIESIESKGSKEFAKAAMIVGCLTIPIETIKPVKIEDMHIISQDQIVVSTLVKNCGMKEDCKPSEFAVHVYTGKNAQDEPKICVDGRYVISKGINDAGRGLNIVLVGNEREILKVARFDTYAFDSTNLELFLESITEDILVIIVSFDEASNKLGTLARNLLFELGSGLVQNLRHRDAWYFVGRKNIKGFTPIEEISYAGADNQYPPPLDKKFCVPQILNGMKIRPDPLPNMNDKRRSFCSRYDGYGDFCLNENIDKQLLPVPIINKTLEDHPIYNTPILVIAGLSHNSLRMTLETLIMQPGIKPTLVYVCLDEKLVEQADLVELFGFNYVSIKSSYNYMDIYHKSLISWYENANEKDKQHVIVIEEELILSPDFLYFFTQTYPVLVGDSSLAAVTSFNPNSYLQFDGSSNIVLRANEFPGLGYLLKRDFYEKYMHNKLKECCNERAWYDWRFRDEDDKNRLIEVDVIMPEVSRVFRRPYDISSQDYTYLQALFNRKRKTNLEAFAALENLPELETKEKYTLYLIKLLKKSRVYQHTQRCYDTGTIPMPKPEFTNIFFKIVYEQNAADDLTNLKKLVKCFHLFNHDTSDPKGLYLRSLLKFSAHNNTFILVGSMNGLLKEY